MLLVAFVGSRVAPEHLNELREAGGSIIPADLVAARPVDMHGSLEIRCMVDSNDQDLGWRLRAYEKLIEKYQSNNPDGGRTT